MKRPIVQLALLALASLASCQPSGQCSRGAEESYQMSPTLGGKLYTSAWIQRSAEYQALCLQSYALATLRLEEALRQHQLGDKPLAVITDIDETILDNTPNSVYQALRGEDYTDESWNEWCARAEADTLAGSVAFFQRAADLGVEVFYISNRYEDNRAGTLANLKRYGYPYADDEHLMLRTSSSDKTERRAAVAERYSVVMLLGDNLGDFDHVFDSIDEGERDRAVDSLRQAFGSRFIVLPNPNYGTWDKAMNHGYPPLEERDKRLREELRSY